MRGINEIMNALRQIPTAGGMSSMGSLGGLASRISGFLPNGSEKPQGTDNVLPGANEEAPPLLQEPPSRRETVPERGAGTIPMLGAKTHIARPGICASKWANPFVSAAIPALLLLHRQERGTLHFDPLQMRNQLGLEVRLFREKLATSALPSQQVEDASYLLCTHIDEVLNEQCRKQDSLLPERSLLVEFHGDAWGGEDCFAKLQQSMAEERPAIPLLEFYEVILGLGFQGRYQVIDRGDILLQDLRSQLHRLIWSKAPEALALRADAKQRGKPAWLTPLRFFLVGAGLLLLAYVAGVIDMINRGNPLREALAAYEPPVREIKVFETLPPPLPELIAEGWLMAERRDNGWLLIFRADGAFEPGRADIRPEFLSNLKRLGSAFAPWPGDLEVIGHTDLTPIVASKFPSNQALSEARAERVAALIRQQTAGGRVQRQVTASGMGEKSPVMPGVSPAANHKNRRVEVLWKVAATKREIVSEIIR